MNYDDLHKPINCGGLYSEVEHLREHAAALEWQTTKLREQLNAAAQTALDYARQLATVREENAELRAALERARASVEFAR